ncbi:MAG: hypothetical protein AAGJ87_13510, partial [Pseudomonadota bacterium]
MVLKINKMAVEGVITAKVSIGGAPAKPETLHFAINDGCLELTTPSDSADAAPDPDPGPAPEPEPIEAGADERT